MFDSLLKEYGEEFKVVEDRYQERYGKGPKAKAVAKPKAEKRQQESKPERRRQPRTPKKAANAA
jgi:hypothetical protein